MQLFFNINCLKQEVTECKIENETHVLICCESPRPVLHKYLKAFEGFICCWQLKLHTKNHVPSVKRAVTSY